ncbi:MAG: tyrosine-specific transport protein [Patescibacteria group bacterium]|jgi:tyrosine-specific transport protein
MKYTWKFWSAVFTLVGSIIGAGILGLPYVFGQAGFLVGTFWLVFLGTVVLVTMLYLGEVILRTKGDHQLPGLAEKYLGRSGKYAMLFAMFFGIYAALLAYLIGEGESLSMLFLGHTGYGLLFGIGFWLILTFFLMGGISHLRRVETIGVAGIILIVIVLFFVFLGDIQVENLQVVNMEYFFLPIAVTLFALLGFTVLPEIQRELKGSEKYFFWVIILGLSLSAFLYFIFTLTFVGMLGNSVGEIATLSFGPMLILLGVFTMFTSYFAFSYALRSICVYDFGMNERNTFLCVSIFPLFLYVLVSLFNIASFITVIGLSGVIAGGTFGVLSVLMNYKSKRMKGRKPEYSIPIHWSIVVLLCVIYVAGIILGLGF